jgi:hypothetical protein
MQFKVTFKLVVLLALALFLTQGRFLQQEGTCCNACPQNLHNRFFIRPNQIKNDIFYALRQNMPDETIIQILNEYPPEYTTSILEVMEELSFRKDMKLMTCEHNANINYETYYGEFSNTTINVIFESIMAAL